MKKEKLSASFLTIYCLDKPRTHKLKSPEDQIGILLLGRRDGLLGFPGGKPDPGETPLETLKREVYEEIGLKIDESRLGDEKFYDLGESFNSSYRYKVTFKEMLEIQKMIMAFSDPEEVTGSFVYALNKDTTKKLDLLRDIVAGCVYEEIQSLVKKLN